ncbi:DsbA family oxidoreductase [Chondrinema litorale]|uniref:DsbA family oxidoreductase n=1 Tax=Chondrinema litorale TaxID=2994555 RepID=UPI002542E874|nr:DsbA family oxidoreductase [Chondrinema litorale]UZR97856.1 DsbA family oxidoreductase [Chondrinema litorale]
MKVEIWSDVMCPWCYVGKRRFEKALAQFPQADQIEVEWKSFQLMPGLKTDASVNINEFLAREKGVSLDQAKQMNDQVSQVAASVGLNYQFDKVVPANTFNAHRFLHFAKTQGKQNEAKERLMHAFFIEGKNLDDKAVLLELGKELGLAEEALTKAINEESFANEVVSDIAEGQKLGLSGVPFFVFNRKYGVSGAQETGVFLRAIEESFADWKNNQPLTDIKGSDSHGHSCGHDGCC